MPTAPLRRSCPHCDKRLALKEDLAGKRIKCPGCQKPFLVEPDEEEEAVVASPRRKAPQPPPEDEDDRVRDDDDDELEERPRKKKKKKKPSAALFWSLIGGGAAAVVAAAVILIVVLNKKGGDGSTPVVKKGDNEEKKGDNQERKGDNQERKADDQEKKDERTRRMPDDLVDVSGPWLPPFPFQGANPDPATVLTFHVALVGDSYKFSQRRVSETEKVITERLAAVVGTVKARTMSSDDSRDGNLRLITFNVAPVTEDLQALAKRIDFGTVRSVDGRVMTVVVRKENVVGGTRAP